MGELVITGIITVFVCAVVAIFVGYVIHKEAGEYQPRDER